MKDLSPLRSVEPAGRRTSPRTGSVLSRETEFVTPWADEPILVVDITEPEPVLRGNARELVAEIAEARRQIDAMEREIRRLRAALNNVS